METEVMKSYWEEFFRTEHISKEIPEKIAESWKNSRSMNVDHINIDEELVFYSREELEKSLDENQWLIETIKPLLMEMANKLQGDNFDLLIFDKTLHLLKVLKNDKQNTDTRRTCIRPGMCYQEMMVGTTSVNLCVRSGKVESLVAYEHYHKAFSTNYCIAVPIYDEKSSLMCVIGIVGEPQNYKPYHKEIMEISGKLISRHVELSRVQFDLLKKSKLYNIIVEASSDGMLSVNMAGEITFINPAGMRILGVERDCIGKHITEAVDFKPTILDVIKQQKGYIDKEFRLEGKKGIVHFVKTAIPLKDDDNNMIGVLDIFRSISEVKTMVNKMTGAHSRYTIENIIGNSTGIQRVKKLIQLASSNDSTVLIQGESGTGKEIIAQAIHSIGNRSKGPFIALNCAALPRDLIESELFGYDEGSFTGASRGGRPGKFELAHGGTLFLDEIGDMPLDMQSKLLRVLQQKTIVRIGGAKEIPVDVRIVAATNKNLEEQMLEKNFREDLYYRINVINIIPPPLRERGSDIRILADNILKRHNIVNGTQKKMSDEVMKVVETWSWPGNVRELENAIEHAYYISGDEDIYPRHLPNKIRKPVLSESSGELMTIKKAEENAIRRAMTFTENNVSQAAKILGIGRNTLYDKLRFYDIEAVKS